FIGHRGNSPDPPQTSAGTRRSDERATSPTATSPEASRSTQSARRTSQTKLLALLASLAVNRAKREARKSGRVRKALKRVVPPQQCNKTNSQKGKASNSTGSPELGSKVDTAQATYSELRTENSELAAPPMERYSNLSKEFAQTLGGKKIGLLL